MINVSLVVPLDMYGQPVFVSIGQNEEQFRESATGVLHEAEINEYAEHLYHKYQPAGCCFDSPNKLVTVWIQDLNRDAAWHGTIGHEVFHAVEAIMQRVGIRYSKSSSEAYAFLIGYIAETIYKHLMDRHII